MRESSLHPWGRNMGYKLEIAQKASEHLDQLLGLSVESVEKRSGSQTYSFGNRRNLWSSGRRSMAIYSMYRLCASKKGIPEGKNTGHGIAYDLSGKWRYKNGLCHGNLSWIRELWKQVIKKTWEKSGWMTIYFPGYYGNGKSRTILRCSAKN